MSSMCTRCAQLEHSRYRSVSPKARAAASQTAANSFPGANSVITPHRIKLLRKYFIKL
jgi:hypothetical protein